MSIVPGAGRSKIVFYFLWTVIIAVSVHDGYLVLVNWQTIADDEQNPIGRWLIALDAGGVRLFLLSKLWGTVVVAAVLLFLFWTQPRVAWPACITLAALQCGLVFYLSSF